MYLKLFFGFYLGCLFPVEVIQIFCNIFLWRWFRTFRQFIVLFLFVGVAIVELIVIVLWHQIGFYVVDGLLQPFQKAIKIFFLQKDFVPFVTIVIESLGTFCEREVKIISFSTTHIKEVRPSFSGADFIRIFTFLPLSVVIIVVHDC